ncbi:MAG: hypothetical protein C4539_14585 [Ignavibacteriales bacterium]|nr:MAG: hypothetical protein C4539_14585 [Ignavibacteriales bacterium]
MIERITFPVEPLCIDADSDTMQCILEFTVNVPGDDIETDADDIALKILEWGDKTIEYDLENAIALPGEMSLKISDPQGFLDNLLFESENIDIQGLVTIKLNGDEEFSGHIIEDGIDSDEGQFTITFDAAPKTDVINKRMVYNDESTALNPFSYTSSSYYSIVTILEDIFSLVNSSISYSGGSLEIIHDWEFYGLKESINVPLMDIVLEELYQLIDPLYFDSSFGLSTVGDVLKKLALDWCSFAGMVSYNKAFFKKLFYYNPDNIQTVNVKKHRKGYRYGLIDYVKVTTNISDPSEPYEQGTFTELEERYLLRKALPGFFDGASSGSNIKAVAARDDCFYFTIPNITFSVTLGDVYSNNSSEFTVIGYKKFITTGFITVIRTDGTNDPEASGTLTKVSGSGDASISFTASASFTSGTFDVYQSRDPNLYSNAFKNHGDLLSKFWYTYRGNIKNCRVDYFQMFGLTYDYLKDFNYDGCKFQPIKMTKHYSKGLTEIEAIYIGAL